MSYPNPKKYGNTTLQRIGFRSTWNARTGGSTVETWKGSYDQIAIKASTLQFLGWTTEIENLPGDLWQLTSTYNYDLVTNPNGKDPLDPPVSWEIVPHEIERNILELSDNAIIGGLTTATKSAIEYKIKHPETSLPPYEQGANALLRAAATEVYNLMRAGVEGKVEYTHALRRTIVVPSTFNLTWSVANVGKVWSKSALVPAYLVPVNRAALLIQGSVEGSTSTIETFGGYLEAHPQINDAPRNQIQVSQEWIYNKWSTLLYTVIT